MVSKYTIIHEKKVSSTNDFAKKLTASEEVAEFTVIVAENQLIGRGQKTNSWHSKENKNITMSIVLYPSFLKASDQFYLSKSVSIGILEYLKKFEKKFCVKWPNDINYSNKKICGILIENSISGMNIKKSIVGIGLNINQKVFPENLPFAESLSNITGKEYSITEELTDLLDNIYEQYHHLKKTPFTQIDRLYHKNLYKIDQVHTFTDENGEFKGTITGTLPNGKLQIKIDKKETREYSFKEVIFH